jgi:hypothetical protein
MLCSNYNVYILCYVDTMLSTYYYIYIYIDTYYVVNGITIVKYLHTVNAHNGGRARYIATVCALYKRGLYAAMRHAIELRGAICTLLVWVMDTVTLHSYALRSRGHRLGLGLVWCVPHSLPPPKKICVFWYAELCW